MARVYEEINSLVRLPCFTATEKKNPSNLWDRLKKFHYISHNQKNPLKIEGLYSTWAETCLHPWKAAGRTLYIDFYLGRESNPHVLRHCILNPAYLLSNFSKHYYNKLINKYLCTKHNLSERSIVNNFIVIRTIYNRAIKLGIVD